MGKDRRFHQIRGLLDTGNDITLLTRAASTELGFSKADTKGVFKVKGIAAAPLNFYMVKTGIKIGQSTPIQANVGLQLDGSTDALRDNLFGRKDILDNFDLYFSKGTVSLHKTGVGVGNTLGLTLPIVKNEIPAGYKSNVGILCNLANIC
jgi:hypothetical protein